MMNTKDSGSTGKNNKRLQRGCLILRGKNYYVKFYLNGKQFKKVLTDDTGKSITNRKEAEKAKEKLLAPYFMRDKKNLTEQMLASIRADDERILEAAKQADNILNPALSFDKAWDTYIHNQERPQSGDRTLKDYIGYWNKFYSWIKENKPALIRLKEVTEETASEYALYLKRLKLSAGTFNKNRDFLKIFFYYLRKPAKIEVNPFENIKRLKDTPDTRREFSIEEIRVVIERASGDLQLLLGLGAFTGLRLGDCCTLQWHEIDLDSKVIKRIPNKTAKNKKPVIIGIPEILFHKLIDIPKSERRGYLLPFYAEKYNNVNTRPHIARAVQDHLKDCGIQVHRPGTGKGTKNRAVLEAGFHSLRHSYISILAKSGVSQSVLIKLAGHSQKMSEHYTHVKPEEARQIADTYSELIQRPENPVPEAITIEPISSTTELKERINRGLQYLKEAAIPEVEKQNLLSILGN